MLAHNEPIHAVQLHIEGILAGGVGGVVAGHHIPARIVVFHRILIVHQGHRAKPGLAGVYPGDHAHPVPLGNGPLLELSDGALHPVGAGLLNGDIGHGIALVIGAAFVDGLDAPRNGRGHRGVFQQFLGLFQLRFLGFQVQLRFLEAHLGRLDLDGILQLFVGADLVPLPLQLADLGLVVLQAGIELLPLQIQLVRRQLELVRIVGEQGVPLFYVLAFLDQQLRHGLIFVFFDLREVFRNHHAGKPVRSGNSIDIGDLLHINRRFLFAAPRQHQCQRQGGSSQHTPFHIRTLLWKMDLITYK